jgi:hypothetical protein
MAYEISGISGGEVMDLPVSAIWHSLPPNLPSTLDYCISNTLETFSLHDSGYVFFRADDVAVPGAKFLRLMEIFTRCRMPLCLAVVPAWLTQTRWQQLERAGQSAPSLWCWHQHGWRHINHEGSGKKQEFGPGRSCLQLSNDLSQGKYHLQNLMGKAFAPIFTPPWNRCDQNTLRLLKELNYRAVSRFRGSPPPPPEGLTDFSVNVDLHTRKEADPIAGWEGLFSELESAFSQRFCGIMIHHQRMNEAAFAFLEIFLQALVRQKRLQVVHFMDLHSRFGSLPAPDDRDK